MPITTKNIEQLNGPNPPGLQMVWLLFADEVLATEPLALEAGAMAYSLFTADLDASVDLNVKPTEALDCDVTIDFPGNTETLAYIRAHFAKRQFLVIAQDLTGKIRQLGTKQFPLTCKISGDSTYKLSFSGHLVAVPEVLEAAPVSVAIEQLARRKGPAPAGILYIHILFASDVISIPAPNEQGIITGNPEIGDTAEIVQYYTGHLNASYNTDIEMEDVGQVHSHKVAIKLAEVSSIDDIIARYRNRQVILILEDFLGEQWLVGAIAKPLTVAMKYESGGDSGFRGYTLSFEGKTDAPAYKLEGDLVPVVAAVPSVPGPKMFDFDPLDFSFEDFY